MPKSVLSKVAWAGRTASMVLGLALILALVVGAASAAFGANGQALILGNLNNAATAITKLTGNVDGGPALRVQNTNAGPNDTALDLRVQAGEAPMTVNSATRVANLNADKLDGKDFGAFGIQGGALQGPLPRQETFTSKGGTHIIWASGSGFRAAGNTRLEGNIGMTVFIDGIPWAHIGVFTNERDSHKAFVSKAFAVRGLSVGEHTIRLEAAYDTGCNTANESKSLHFCTTTNDDDRFEVTILEIPD